jgi:hypothetical protein
MAGLLGTDLPIGSLKSKKSKRKKKSSRELEIEDACMRLTGKPSVRIVILNSD